jgi:hypothetical protein
MIKLTRITLTSYNYDGICYACKEVEEDEQRHYKVDPSLLVFKELSLGENQLRGSFWQPQPTALTLPFIACLIVNFI